MSVKADRQKLTSVCFIIPNEPLGEKSDNQSWKEERTQEVKVKFVSIKKTLRIMYLFDKRHCA